MSKLQYKTIAGEHPQGKPNVYFSCHPEDFEKYFEEYALKIFHIQDCAIWYEAEPEADYDRENLELDLSQMQLLIMPVTTKLLTTSNRAMDIEFPIAQEKHIPVLPLMMERGLVDVFSERFGDLQYMDPNNRDETRRSFDEVLETYIRSTLVSSELANKIRAVFDAYIFLSYRKKDRKKAQELMRLIHRNPLCRDIAIWYDEFLIPGEDFNQAIETMLEKSDLFTLVVTPNLVNEVNYVMTTEYPEAIKQKKTVLPVEMEETDRKELDEHYKSLPPCVRVEEYDKFQDALLEVIREIAVLPNDRTPEHNFLIGLAYLDGIDMEVDSERAVELITEAAEAEVPEAMQKIAIMYETGEGVARDYHAGLEWREKYVEMLRRRYKDNAVIQTATDYFLGLQDLTYALYNLAFYDKAEEVVNEMLSIAPMFDDRYLPAKRWLPISYDLLGMIKEAQGREDDAKKYYEKELEYFLSIKEEARTIQDRRDIVKCCRKIGIISKGAGKLIEAERYITEALRMCTALADENKTIDSLYDLSEVYSSMGNLALEWGVLGGEKEFPTVYSDSDDIEYTPERTNTNKKHVQLGYLPKRRRLEEAKKYYEKGKKIWFDIAENRGTEEDQRKLLRCYLDMGRVAEILSLMEEANDYYKKGHDISIVLADETGTIEDRRSLSSCYYHMAKVAAATERWSSAEEYIYKGLKISLDLTEKIRTVNVRRDLSLFYDEMGSLAEKKGRLEEASKYYVKEMKILSQLVNEGGTINDRRGLIKCYEKSGHIAKTMGSLIEAKNYYEKCLEVLSKVEFEVNRFKSIREQIFDLGFIQEREAVNEEIERYYLMILKVNSEIFKKANTVEAYRDLADSYQKMVEVTWERADDEEIEKYLLSEMEIRRKLAECPGTDEDKLLLASTYERLGTLHQYNSQTISQKCDDTLSQLLEDQDNEVAFKYYDMCLKICYELSERTGSIESRRALSVALCNMGDIVLPMMYEPMIGGLIEEIDLETEFHEQFSELDIFSVLKRVDKAKSYYESSLKFIKAVARETESIEDRYILTACYKRLSELASANERTKEAKQYLVEVVHIFEDIVEETDEEEYTRTLSAVYDKYGDLFYTLGELLKAKEWYEKEKKLSLILFSKYGIDDYYSDLASVHRKLGLVAKRQGNLDAAQRHFEESIRYLSGFEKLGYSIESELSYTYVKLGEITEGLNRLEEAIEYYKKGLKIFLTLNEVEFLIIRCNDKLAHIYRTLGHDEDANKYLKSSLKYYGMFYKGEKKENAYRNISKSYVSMGYFFYEMLDVEEAKKGYTKGLEACLECVERMNTSAARNILKIEFFNLGAFLFNNVIDNVIAKDIFQALYDNEEKRDSLQPDFLIEKVKDILLRMG